MSKTPFEIRLELISIANQILSEKNFKDYERITENWRAECETERLRAERYQDIPNFKPFPDLPVVNEELILELAKKLNRFVSTGLTNNLD